VVPPLEDAEIWTKPRLEKEAVAERDEIEIGTAKSRQARNL